MQVRPWPTRLFVTSVVVVVSALAVSFWLVSIEQQRLYDRELTERLLTKARMLREGLRGQWNEEAVLGIAGLIHILRSSGTDVAILSVDGRVWANPSDRIADPAALLEDADMRAALASGWSEATRRRARDGRLDKVVAVRVGNDLEALGVVRLSHPMWTLAGDAHLAARLVSGFAAVALIVIVALSWVLLRFRTRLLQQLVATARNLSAGDLSVRSDVGGAGEYAMLSAALNEMRHRLQSQVDTIDRQKLTLENLIHQLRDGVIVVNRQERIVLINPTAIQLLGLDRSGGETAFAGQPVERLISQRAVRRMLQPPREAPLDAAGEQPACPAEARIALETDGVATHLLARASSLTLPAGNEQVAAASVGRLLVLTDVTELERSIQARSDFVANASHELRTPLSAIRVTVEALLTMDLVRQERAAREFIDTIDRQSQRLQALVSDLLDLTRLEAPTVEFEPEPVELAHLFEDLRTRFAHAVDSGQLGWDADHADMPSPTINVNSQLLGLILDNLVENAIKFTEPNGRISVGCRPERDGVCFFVADTGCGIPAADQTRVFERFYQVERARSGTERGTGLGLSIVRHAVNALNGAVTIDSAVGRGTRVEVWLPLAGHDAVVDAAVAADPDTL